MSIPSVAVIGAGMAGLSCAQHLQQLGCQVTVFDKGRLPGGRMSTRQGDGWQADHGAQYFTARDQRFGRELARWEAAGVAAAWHPQMLQLGAADAGDQVDEVRHTRQNKQAKIGSIRYVGTPRMSSPAGWLADQLQVQTRVTICQIEHGDDGWALHSLEHGLHGERYDAVLFAVPAPQAAALLEPLLPLTALQARAVAMQACWTLMLRFEQDYLPGYDAMFVNQGPLRWIARDRSKPGRQGDEVWVAHASAEWSEQHVELASADVVQQLTVAWQALGGPAPSTVVAHRWRYARAANGANQRAQWLPAVQVGLCGDWLAGARVEDAWLSGRELAAQVAAALMPQALTGSD